MPGGVGARGPLRGCRCSCSGSLRGTHLACTPPSPGGTGSGDRALFRSLRRCRQGAALSAETTGRPGGCARLGPREGSRPASAVCAGLGLGRAAVPRARAPRPLWGGPSAGRRPLGSGLVRGRSVTGGWSGEATRECARAGAAWSFCDLRPACCCHGREEHVGRAPGARR